MTYEGVDPGAVIVGVLVAMLIIAAVSTWQFWSGVNRQAAGTVKNENRLLDRRKSIQKKKQSRSQKKQQPSKRKQQPKRRATPRQKELDEWQFD